MESSRRCKEHIAGDRCRYKRHHTAGHRGNFHKWWDSGGVEMVEEIPGLKLPEKVSKLGRQASGRRRTQRENLMDHYTQWLKGKWRGITPAKYRHLARTLTDRALAQMRNVKKARAARA